MVSNLKSKRLLLAGIIICLMQKSLLAQNVGIGTQTPQKLLSVNGSIILDQGNSNFGTLDSAALLFGNLGGVGISSQKTNGDLQWGLSLWTNNLPRLNIRNNGNVGIGTTDPTSTLHVIGNINASSFIYTPQAHFTTRVGINGWANASYRLHVQNGDSYFEGKGTFDGAVGVGGVNNTGHQFYVNGTSRFTGTVNLNGILNGMSAGFTNNVVVGTTVSVGTNATIGNNLNVGNDGIIDGNFRVNGRVGINGATNANYGLIVNNANSYFQGNTITTGNATVQGNTSLQGNLTIKGNGHVRSNGASSLLVGFTTKAVSLTVPAGGSLDVEVSLPAFNSANDMRVQINQFEPSTASGGFYYYQPALFNWYVYDVNPATNSCKIRVKNNHHIERYLYGVFYLTTTQRET